MNDIVYLLSSDSSLHEFICTSGRTSLSNMAGNTKVQEIEVSAIKAEFDGTCRVIKDLGEFTHVLTLQPSGKDIIYKFQMTGTYFFKLHVN